MTDKPRKRPGRKPGSKSGYTMTEKAIAQREKNLPSPLAKTPEEIQYNARLIDFVLKVQAIASQTDITDPVSIKAAFFNYLTLCQEYGFKVSNLSACAAIGINKVTLWNWSKSNKPEYREIANFINATCALSREQMISDNKLNPVIGIFWQRNYDGLRNDTEQQQSIDDSSNDDIKTASEYAKKYGHLLEE